MSDIDVVIDTLDLTGVPPARRHQVVATFERELRRLILLQGLPATATPGRTDGERAVPLAVAPTANPLLVGRALAESVYEGLR